MRYAQSLDEIERPALLVSKNGALPSPELAAEKLGTPLFDIIIARESWRKAGLDQSPKKHFEKIATEARELLAAEGRIVLLESPPLLGERISRHLQSAELSGSLLQDLQTAESAFFEGEATRWNWDADDIQEAFTSAGFLVEIEILDQGEERPIGNKEILAWFDSEQSSWGKHISEKLGSEAFEKLRSAFVALCSKGPLLWKWKSLLVHSRPERGR
ncbi:hypothetical protein MASR2M78_04130 [Treponema sp.]